jgi:hypothetical protein
MTTSRYRGTPHRSAHTLFETYGACSAGEAAERAEDSFSNIDVGGFAYWKSVEKLIRTRLHADTARA